MDTLSMQGNRNWNRLLAIPFLLLFGLAHGKPEAAAWLPKEFGVKHKPALLTVTIRLVDAESDVPVEKGQISVTDEKTRQVLPVVYDSLGRRFSISVPAGTSLRVRASAAGYLSASLPLTNLNSSREIVIRLSKPKPSVLVVKVFATTIRQPLASADVRITSRITGRTERFSLPTGRLDRTFTEPDELDILVSADGYTSVSRRLTIDVPPSGKRMELDVELDKRTLGVVIWAIDNQTNQVVSKARFTLTGPYTASLVKLSAGSEAGQVTAKVTDRGTYQLTTIADGYEESIRSVVIENEQNPVMVRLIARPQVRVIKSLTVPNRIGSGTPAPATLPPPSMHTARFRVLETGKRVQLDRIYFDQSSALLRPESYAELDELAAALWQNASVQIELRGYTDNQGDFDLNVRLSRDRCQSVIDYLMGKGIQKSRFKAVGRGPLDPLAPNNTEDNRKKNRRVEFVVL